MPVEFLASRGSRHQWLHQRVEDVEAERLDTDSAAGTPPFAGNLRGTTSAVRVMVRVWCGSGQREQRRESEGESEVRVDEDVVSSPLSSHRRGKQEVARRHGRRPSVAAEG